MSKKRKNLRRNATLLEGLERMIEKKILTGRCEFAVILLASSRSR